VGLDQTTLDLMQTGSDQTVVQLKHNLLDEKLSYHFGVTSLSVPLNEAPIFKVAVDTEIMRIGRRNAGNTVTLAVNTTVAYNAYIADDSRKFYDVTTFVRDMNNWARGFEKFQTLLGIENLAGYGGLGDVANPPLIHLPHKDAAGIAATGTYSFLNFKLSPDGRLIVTGSTHFFNNFFLKFTQFGAALLGLGEAVHSVPLVGGAVIVPDYYLAYSTIAGVQSNSVAGWLDIPGGYLILQGDNTKDVGTTGNAPLYQTADQRVSVSVESHLPVASNVKISDQKETVDRTIVEKFFESQLECTVNFGQDGTFESQQVTNNIYSGQISFIKKSDRHTQWHRLMTAYQLSYFRFHLFLTRRVYNLVTNTWSLKKEALKIPAEKYWDMQLRFVSDT
jgi:hypothetical protein